MGKFRIIASNTINIDIISYYNIIVNFTNPSMIKSPGISTFIYKKAGEKKLEKYIKNKYKLQINNKKNYMKVGTIRITPGFNLGTDIMFVRAPINENEASKSLLIEVYNNILKNLYKNEYKYILIFNSELSTLGFTDNEIGSDIYKLISDFIKDKDINIDLLLSNKNNRKFYK